MWYLPVFCHCTEEANDQKKAFKDQCADLKEKMDEDGRLASVAKVQAESYRKRLEKFETEVKEERKKADRVSPDACFCA